MIVICPVCSTEVGTTRAHLFEMHDRRWMRGIACPASGLDSTEAELATAEGAQEFYQQRRAAILEDLREVDRLLVRATVGADALRRRIAQEQRKRRGRTAST